MKAVNAKTKFVEAGKRKIAYKLSIEFVSLQNMVLIMRRWKMFCVPKLRYLTYYHYDYVHIVFSGLMFTRSLFHTPDMITQHHMFNTVADLIDSKKIKTTLTDPFTPINIVGKFA